MFLNIVSSRVVHFHRLSPSIENFRFVFLTGINGDPALVAALSAEEEFVPES